MSLPSSREVDDNVGQQAVTTFLRRCGLRLVIGSHDGGDDGYRMSLYDQVLDVFSNNQSNRRIDLTMDASVDAHDITINLTLSIAAQIARVTQNSMCACQWLRLTMSRASKSKLAQTAISRLPNLLLSSKRSHWHFSSSPIDHSIGRETDAAFPFSFQSDQVLTT
jgi:hypothetical protein